MHTRYLIILAGPTAVGKTPLAIQLARQLGTEIINADSRQIYREMRIGTAIPTPLELAEIRHHFIGHKSIHEQYNASMFEQEALKLVDVLFTRYDSVVMTGGSGLYIDAVCRGIDDIPSVDPLIRERLQKDYLSTGLTGLQARLRISDPDYYRTADLNNPKRLLKALEIIEITGKPYSSFLTGKAKPRKFETLRICLDMPRDELHERINRRVDTMMSEGLLDEVRELYPFKELNALNTVGYKELFEHIEGKHSLNEAVEMIKGHTRQYARRQLTWFRRNKTSHWFLPREKEGILNLIGKFMKKHGTI